MICPVTRLLLATIALSLTCSFAVAADDKTAAAEPQLGHMVFFKLKESTPEAKAKLVAACDKYLSGHEGTVYYSAGVLAEDLKRDVNDRDFDVALHLVFNHKGSYEKYAVAPRHLDFIKENKDTWGKVRVFDSYVKPTKAGK